MHRCYGCMELTDREICPRCGWPADGDNGPRRLRAGTILRDQYLVGRVLGQGGFGITYLGWDKVLDEPVAIKEFFPRDLVSRDPDGSACVTVYSADMEPAFASGRERIVREAQALAKLRDVPQIVGVRNCFQANGTAYIIMEYVRGMDLVHFVRQRGGRLTVQETLTILDPVMAALEKVHRQGLIHRDISPDNIMLDVLGNTRLLDFGAVRNVEGAELDADLSHSTEAIVKHGYAPTEQYRTRGSLGPWTDEYALCATVWYCLTGETPPDALALSMEDEVLDRAKVPGLTDAQWKALKKGMSPRAKDRFGDLGLLRQALQGRAPGPAKKKKKRRPLMVALLAAALLAAGAIGYLSVKALLPGEAAGPAVPGPAQTASEPAEDPTAAPTAAPTSEPADTPTEEPSVPTTLPPEPWEANVMTADPFAVMGVDRESVVEVRFISTTEGAPEKTWDVSRDGDGSVLAWMEIGQIVLAAEGGINGRESCAGLFADCTQLKKVSFGGSFHTEQTVDMSNMFRHCLRLETVDAGDLDTSAVTDMHGMFDMLHRADGTEIYSFEGNRSLTSLDLSTWDVSKVTDMSDMFYHCDVLEELGCEEWDTSSVTDMSGMFYWCRGLRTPDLNSWDTGSVKDFSYMFNQCNALSYPKVSAWDVSQAQSLAHMFEGCTELRIIDLQDWDTGNVRDISYMFYTCRSLEGPDISGWDVSSLQDASHMFHYALAGGDFDLSGWDTSSLLDVSYMFEVHVHSITVSGVSNWDLRGIASDRDRYYRFAPWGIKIDGKDWVYWFL